MAEQAKKKKNVATEIPEENVENEKITAEKVETENVKPAKKANVKVKYPILWFNQKHQAAISKNGSIILYVDVDPGKKIGDLIEI